VGKVIVVGGSMGGTAALTFTVLHPELVDGVVSQCGFASLFEPSRHRASIARSFGNPPDRRPDEYRKRSAERAPEKFTMPIAIWTGGRDNSVPPQSAIRFAQVLKSKNPQNVLHIHREKQGHTPGYEDTITLYEFVLKAVASPPK
jgi:pimeloyl-ACP methyl ester carboxylesterase